MLTAIAAQPTLPAVLAQALAAFVAVAGCERGFLLRLSGFEVLDQVVHGATPDAYSTSLADRVAWSGEPVAIADLDAVDELRQAASVQALGLRAALGMPLVAGGEIVGVMLADSQEAHPGFTPEALALARALADHVVVALENAARAERLRDTAAADALLAHAALEAAGARSLDAALPALARAAGLALGAERVFLHAPDGTPLAALDAAGQPLAGARASDGVIGWVVAHGEPLIVVDALAAPVGSRSSVEALALRAIHAAPVWRGDDLAAVLYADSREPGVGRPEAGRLLEGLAAIVGALLARG